MATAEQIKALIRSHLSDDTERFYTLALQVAAHEAQQGHGALAHDIREIVDKAKRTRGGNVLLAWFSRKRPISLFQPWCFRTP
jgi:hypothetical protein